MLRTALLASALAAGLTLPAHAGQAPRPASAADRPISHRDRVYAAEQFSNTVSVTDPADNRLLGVIRLGDPAPANFSPLYRGQVLVHGLGFSPDGGTLAVVSIGSNGVTFVDTATNRVRGTTYVGRSPHEAFFTPDGREVWVTVRGEDYIAVLDPGTMRETGRIQVPPGPGMAIFSPDGTYAYVCSSFTPETTVIRVADRSIVGKVAQPSAFCPNIAAAPDGDQVWFTLKDVGKVVAFNAKPPFDILRVIDTGPITNHVNFVRTAEGQFAYVTVGGLGEIQVYRTDTFAKTATIPVGKLPHGLWPSADGKRVYVGLENEDALTVIDTSSLKVVGQVAVGQAPQAVVYVPDAVPDGDGLSGLQPLGLAANTARLSLAAPGQAVATGVTLFDQGLVQVLQASVTGLAPKSPYVLALADRPDGQGPLQPLSTFTTNPAGAAIVNAIAPIRQLIGEERPPASRRYLVIAAAGASPTVPGVVVQVQTR